MTQPIERNYRIRFAYLDWDGARQWTPWKTVRGFAEYRPNGLPLAVEREMGSGIVLTHVNRYIPQSRVVAAEWEEVALDAH